MDFIKEYLAFEKWLKINYLPSLSQLLWHKLFGLFNMSGWSEWVTVSNTDLMAMIQVKREATFIELRNHLIRAGLIEYRKGKKGSPNQYRYISICTFTGEVNTAVKNNCTFTGEVNTEVNTVVETEVNTVAETVDLYKTKTKRKTKTKTEEKSGEKNRGEMERILEKGFSGPVREALAEWLTYKRERGESYKPTGLRAILTETENKIGRYGENAIIAVIRQSMANGWKGIIWDKLGEPTAMPTKKNPSAAIGAQSSSIDMEKIRRMLHREG